MFLFVHIDNYGCLLTGDQLVLYYGFAHRSVKWWKRVFFHLLDLSLVNAHILHKAATGSKMTLMDFRSSVAKSLLEGLERPRNRHVANAPELLRLTERASRSQSPTRGGLTVMSVVIEEWGNVTRLGIGANCAIQLCAYTHVSSGTIRSKIIK